MNKLELTNSVKRRHPVRHVSVRQGWNALVGILFLCGVCEIVGSAAYAEPTDSLRIAAVGQTTSSNHSSSSRNAAYDTVPDWATEAVFYQIFPERFCNGDVSNDPTRESLEFPETINDKWTTTPWSSDWYARSEWEKQQGPNFFDNGVFDRRYGGDLQGVLDKLDYLQDLGINVLYFNPVFYARSLHKYDGNTYHHVDPHFGPDPQSDLALMATETSDPKTWQWTAADKLFLEVVKTAHKKGMRVILDGVFNHTGRGFFAFENLCKEQENSPYRDWYLVQSFDDPSTDKNEFAYKGWWGVQTLPEFADTADGKDLHPGPKQYVFDATARWMDPNLDGDPSDGIDGWRLDVAPEVPVGFWHDWNAHVRALNPESYTVAEHWEDAAKFLAEGGFSATMNYHGFAWPVKGYLIDGTLSPTDMAQLLKERMADYPKDRRYAMQNLVDSHDTDRVASMIVNAPKGRPYLNPDRFDYDVSERVSPRQWPDYDIRKPSSKERRIQRMVMVMQSTFVGAPMLYYGTESGMWGADDPCDRMPMVWREKRYDPQASSPFGEEVSSNKVYFDRILHSFYRSAISLRNSFPALCKGDFKIIHTDDINKGLVFSRSYEDQTIYVIFNRGSEKWEADFSFEAAGPGTLQEIFSASGEHDKIQVHTKEQQAVVILPPLEAAVLMHHKTN